MKTVFFWIFLAIWICCAAIAVAGIGMIFYYHHVDGSWLSDNVQDWYVPGMISAFGMLIIGRILGELA